MNRILPFRSSFLLVLVASLLVQCMNGNPVKRDDDDDDDDAPDFDAPTSGSVLGSLTDGLGLNDTLGGRRK